MQISVRHLLEHPEQMPQVARWIYDEWWAQKPDYTVEDLEARLRQADHPDRIPLSLVAVANQKCVGTINLVEHDQDERPNLSPWLAALLVLPEYRGKGVGSILVRNLLTEARRIKVEQLYLGTDIPEFYARFGAQFHEQLRPDLCIMRIDLNVTNL